MVAKKKVANIEINASECDCKCRKGNKCGGCGYFAGFVGAAIYYLSTATGFWIGVLGLLKASVWPVFLVYELLKFLGA